MIQFERSNLFQISKMQHLETRFPIKISFSLLSIRGAISQPVELKRRSTLLNNKSCSFKAEVLDWFLKATEGAPCSFSKEDQMVLGLLVICSLFTNTLCQLASLTGKSSKSIWWRKVITAPHLWLLPTVCLSLPSSQLITFISPYRRSLCAIL